MRRRRWLPLVLSASLAVSGLSVSAAELLEELPAVSAELIQEAETLPEEFVQVPEQGETAEETTELPQETPGEILPDGTVPGEMTPDEILPGDGALEEIPAEMPSTEESVIEEGTGETVQESQEEDLFGDGQAVEEAGDEADPEEEEESDEEVDEESEEAETDLKGWQWDGTAFSYYDEETGDKVELTEVFAGIPDYIGIVEINGQKYALKDNGVPILGHKKMLDGNYYYFARTGTEIPGAMICGSWVKEVNGYGTFWGYYEENGVYRQPGNGSQNVVTRLDANVDPSISPKGYYVLNCKGYLAHKNKVVKAVYSDGIEYNGYVDGSGQLLTNRLVEYKGKKYYVRNYRCVQSKTVAVGGKTYYFQSSGVMATWTDSWHAVKFSDGKNYFQYFGSDSSIIKKTGWQRVTTGGTTKWYLFFQSGKHARGCLYRSSNGNIYGFSSSGALLNGVGMFDGNRYYFKASTATKPNGYAVKGAVKINGRVCVYADPATCILVKGWQQIDGNYYYFGDNCRSLINQAMKLGDEWGYLDSYGKWNRAGWMTVNQSDGTQKKYYINPEDGESYRNCWKTIGGYKFYFQADGSICTKVDQLPGISYSYYNIGLNRATNTMTIYSPDWTTPIRVFPVSVGTAATPTPQGSFRITPTGQRWTMLMGPSYGQWASHFTGGCYMHSIPYDTPNVYTMYPGYVLNALGTAQSHGCVRMTVSDVYWVYTHCGGGTIRVYDNEPMPLGTPKKYNIPSGQRYDPTDWNVPENHLTGPVW